MADEYHLDYETYSEEDITAGAYRYSLDPSTEVFMCSISKNDGDTYLWINPKYEIIDFLSDPRADKLMREAFSDPEAVLFAHNAQFEDAITLNALKMPRKPPKRKPDHTQWRCTAAMARRAGLPASLDKISRELDIDQKKDRAGKALINFFCKPKKDGTRNMPWDYPEKWIAFCNYCIQDTRTEKAVHQKLLPFAIKGPSLRAWNFDTKMNRLGFPVNVRALENADKMVQGVMKEAVSGFKELTGLAPTQNAKCLAWFKERGYPHDNMQAETLKEFISSGETLDTEDAQKALVMKSKLGFAAVKKVTSMLKCVCPDGRVRGCFVFCGASNTGRWSATLVQPHNFKRPTFKRTDLAFELIEHGATADEIEMLFGNPLEVIASCIRHFIGPKRGKFLDADYSAIEARVVCWLAGDEQGLQEFRDYDDDPKSNPEPYCIMGGKIFNRTVTKKEEDALYRFVGKQAVLGCGFGMGHVKFMGTCESYGQTVSVEVAKEAVRVFRETRKPVANLWRLVDIASKNAIRNPGQVYEAGKKLRFVVLEMSGIPMLIMKLPSGRNLTYPYPKLKNVTVTLDEKDPKTGKKKTFQSQQIEHYGPIPNKRGVFGTIKTYGGKLVENATQGTAYDLMAHGGCNADDHGYDISMVVHDQAIQEKKPGQTIEDFCDKLSKLPNWGEGIPLKAEGAVTSYYTKN